MMNMVELKVMVEVLRGMVRVTLAEKLNFTFQLRVAVTEGSELIPKRHTLNISINQHYEYMQYYCPSVYYVCQFQDHVPHIIKFSSLRVLKNLADNFILA